MTRRHHTRTRSRTTSRCCRRILPTPQTLVSVLRALNNLSCSLLWAETPRRCKKAKTSSSESPKTTPTLSDRRSRPEQYKSLNRRCMPACNGKTTKNRRMTPMIALTRFQRRSTVKRRYPMRMTKSLLKPLCRLAETIAVARPTMRLTNDLVFKINPLVTIFNEEYGLKIWQG